jgi:hypothetical protein
VPSKPPDPLFIGGTGRCGSHALAKLLTRHSNYRTIPVEVRFHSDPPGLPALLEGEVRLDEFLAKLRGPWWKSTHSDGSPRGLHRHVPAETFDPAVDAFERDFESDPDGASVRLIRSLLDPIAAEAGKPSWIEHTKNNVASGQMLLRLFPDSKVIHILRDGRDTAASLVHQSFGPNKIGKALLWWEERLALTEQGAALIPEDRLLMIRFEDLFVNDREATYARLLEFTGIEEERRMERFFGRRTGPAETNTGRWREGLSPRRRRKLTKQYLGALHGLISTDSPARPLLERMAADAESEPA